jgi:hypothetical protein
MAEVQKNTANATEMAQRFVQFIIMQAQQILFVLGNPTPEGDTMPPNLEGGRMLIDQLEMIQEKTRGNLSEQEANILEQALSRVRLAFVQASGGTPASMMPRHTAQQPVEPEFEEEPEPQPTHQPEPQPQHPSQPAPAANGPITPSAPEEHENKKKFTKTYN